MKHYYFQIINKDDKCILYDSKKQGHPTYISEFIAEQIADDIIGFVLQINKKDCEVNILPCIEHVVSQCMYMEHNL